MDTSLLSSADTAEQLTGTAFSHFSVALYGSYETSNFATATEFVDRVAQLADAVGHHPEVHLGYGSVVFELSSHDAGGVTARDVDLATRIQAIADSLGATASARPASRYTICIDAVDPGRIRDFWRIGMDYDEKHGDEGVELVDPRGLAPTIWFQQMDPPRTDRNRIHLDVYLAASEAETRVHSIVVAGGTLVTDQYAPGWWVLADAEGNELCVCTAD